jgi:hypothetical protein
MKTAFFASVVRGLGTIHQTPAVVAGKGALGSVRSPSLSLSLSPPGQSCLREPDEAVILEIRRRWSDCYRALMDTGVALRRGVKIALTCWDVCINNRNIKQMSASDFSDLRAGLNAMAQVLKLRA